MRTKKFFLAIGFCLAWAGISSSFAQTSDTTVQKKVRITPYLRWINEDSFTHDRLRYYRVDTSISTLHLVNTMETNFRSYLANNGSASDMGLFRYSPSVWAGATVPGYDFLLKRSPDIRYYSTNKRFTELTYFSGARKEQTIRISHSQNITQNWNAGVDFMRAGAWGFLLNSRTFQNSINVYSWYHTKNNRYHALAHATWEKVENEVNGGVKSDSLYDNLDLDAQELQGLPVKISGAQNHVWSRVFSVKQFFDLGEKKDFDTAVHVFKYKPFFRLGLDSKLERYAFNYIDGTNDSDYYANTYYDDTRKDSMYSQNFFNEFSILHAPGDSGSVFNRLFYSAGVAYQWLEYRQRSIDNAYGNMRLKAEVRTAENDTVITAGVSGEYLAAGDQSGNYRATGFVNVPLPRAGTVGVTMETGQTTPQVYFERYYSNHFISERAIQSIPYTKTTLRYYLAPWKLETGASFWSMTHYAYFDADALPAQFDPTLNVTQLYVKKNFAWRRLRLDNTLWYQHTNEDSILHIPELCSYHALYYAVPAFKKAMYFEAGIDAHVQTHTYGNDFMPSTGFFYLQNTYRTSGYVLFNLFFNFRIKTADIFLKLENMGKFFIDNKYYLVPHQPMQLRTFKFGIRWRFYDQ